MPSGSAASAACAASGNSSCQKVRLSLSAVSLPALAGEACLAAKVATENVFPARLATARRSARFSRMWSISSSAKAAASPSAAAAFTSPSTPCRSSELMRSMSASGLLPVPGSPPPKIASSSPYLRLDASNRLCSYVALVTKRYTRTSLVCPMRWQRAIACRSAWGFQSLSYMMAVSAAVRVMPMPPARVESKNTNPPPLGSLKRSIADWRSAAFVSPSKRS
mmetsp:Transcript_24314/g.83111  ORF Transcript_24314/g.83111 Transcript_24314/m.83111 type:complete len:222 (-) Transcript_24314:2263-2928(-)